MCLEEEDEQTINKALQEWRQGDASLDDDLEFLHLADLSRPHSNASIQIAASLKHNGETVESKPTPVLQEVCGIAVLSQTCDIVRGCRERPFLEVAPLVEVDKQTVEEIRRLKRPAYAYVPAVAREQLVADLDRTMTVEKSLISALNRIPGCKTDDQRRDFALALARKRSRFPFPDDFVTAARKFQRNMVKKHDSQTEEGAHLRAIEEIRVRAAPSWHDEEVELEWWLIKEHDPEGVQADWQTFIDKWFGLFDKTGRFDFGMPTACRLEDITARDYVESDRLDLDRLSVS
ncbi:MAG: hypothetical protein F4Z15_07815 [Gammaproteobacteria bacterium]|nr:hypothetical protein [Gammaproteobacteria bacterium]MYJ52926.1 hypothetical protein [Gammaproteobacteria bacterium]